jgi:hypothetical protein
MTPLPAIGDGYERATLDLKLRVDAKKGFHAAKDVAAFANHLGGTLLVGAQETNGCVGKYEPLDEPTANASHAAISQAVRDRCSPRPLIDFVRRPHQAGIVLAVNVWPYIGQVIGVAVKCRKEHDGYGDDAYVFPVRVGVDSVYLLPEQLPMFMLPEVRRVVILLQRIPQGEPVRVRIGTYPEGAIFDASMGDVNELANAVIVFKDSKISNPRIFPLDQVSTVVKDEHGWLIVVRKYAT